MGMFDFLSGDGSGQSAQSAQGMTEGFDYMKLLEDPNFIKAMGQAGVSFSQGKGAGEALGGAAQTYTTNKALQGAEADRIAKQQAEKDQFLRALQGSYGNNLVGPAEDMNTANKITIGPDSIDFSYPNQSATPQTKQFSGEQDPLESVRPRATPQQRQDLPDFSRGSASDTANIDLRGLGREELAYLSGARARQEQLNRGLLTAGLSRADKDIAARAARAAEERTRQAALAAGKSQREHAKAMQEDRQKHASDMTKLQSQLSMAVSPLEKQRIEKEMEYKDALIRQADASAAGGLSASDRIAQARLNLSQKKFTQQLSDAEVDEEDFYIEEILGAEKVTPEVALQATRANQRKGKTTYYYPERSDGWFTPESYRMNYFTIPPVGGKLIDAPTFDKLVKEKLDSGKYKTVEEIIRKIEGGS